MWKGLMIGLIALTCLGCQEETPMQPMGQVSLEAGNDGPLGNLEFADGSSIQFKKQDGMIVAVAKGRSLDALAFVADPGERTPADLYTALAGRKKPPRALVLATDALLLSRDLDRAHEVADGDVPVNIEATADSPPVAKTLSSVEFRGDHCNPSWAAWDYCRTNRTGDASYEHNGFWSEAVLHPYRGSVCIKIETKQLIGWKEHEYERAYEGDVIKVYAWSYTHVRIRVKISYGAGDGWHLAFHGI